MIIKNKTILISLFSLVLFLAWAGIVWAQACPPGFNYCDPPGACLPEQGENPECTAQNRGTDICGNCTGCLPGFINCDGECVEPYEGENPECQAQGRGTDQCGNCTGCAPGKILCDGECVDPLEDTNDPSCDDRNRGFNQCTGACTGCKAGWYDCESDPNNVCEQNGSLEGTACGGGLGICEDACCNNCQIDQPHVPMWGDFGTPAPDDASTVDTESNTNPIIYIDHLDPDSLDHDYMKFSTNGNSEFIVNNKGHLMIGLNADGTVLAPADNVIYALVEGTAQGNFLLFQKSGAAEDIFSISHEGEICWNGECRSSWSEAGGVWTTVEGPPDYVYHNDVGDYGADDGGLRISDAGDLLMDGNLTINRTIGAEPDDGLWLGIWDEAGNVQDHIDSHAEGAAWQDGLRIDADGNIMMMIDKNDNSAEGRFLVLDESQNWVFSADEDGNINAPGCFGPVYVGFSAESTGGAGGYAGANALCDAAEPGSHVCTTKEILNSINCGSGLEPAPPIGYAWISNGPPGYTAPANDCQGWNSGLSTNLGDLWRFDQNKGVAATCNVVRPFACCR